jgi:hypothetical protein
LTLPQGISTTDVENGKETVTIPVGIWIDDAPIRSDSVLSTILQEGPLSYKKTNIKVGGISNLSSDDIRGSVQPEKLVDSYTIPDAIIKIVLITIILGK